LVTCREPVGVVALVENRRGYMGLGRGGLPSSPLPLIRVLMQQSGCFRVVDRQAGLQQAVREQELRDQGVLRSDRAGSVARGRGFMAQYSLLPSLTFSEQEAGRGIGGVLTDLGEATGAAPAVKFKEAQVVLLLTDNETTEQVAAATGSARTSDFGIGALVFGDRGVQVGLGWSNTNEGKVIAAAILDAYNQLVRQLQAMTPKELPVATEGLRPLPGR
jgi:curli biogenesis system outer membrane secretion channel CsgG